jgi:hypothetical protein
MVITEGGAGFKGTDEMARQRVDVLASNKY